MTGYKILNTVFRTTTAIVLIGASITVPNLAGATDNFFLSEDIHAAATEATHRFEDELRLELAEAIRPPTAIRVNLVVTTGQMDDVVQEDQLMSSDATNDSRPNDT